MNTNSLEFVRKNCVTLLLAVAFIILLISFGIKKRAIHLTTQNPKLTSFAWKGDSIIIMQMGKNEVSAFKLALINTGSNVLHIKNIKTTCGCTDVNVSSEKILQGDSAFFAGKINSKGMQGVNLSVISFKANTLQKDHKIFIKYHVSQL